MLRKKVFLGLVVALSLFIVVGCSKSSNNGSSSSIITENVNSFDTKVDTFDFKFDKSKTLKKASFVYSGSTSKMEGENYFIADYRTKSNTVFVFRYAINYYESQKIEDVMSQKKATSKGTKKINNYEYQIYEGKIQSGEKSIFYVYQYNNDTYLMTFISNYNLDDLIDKFMNALQFN